MQLLNDFTARARRSGIPTLIYALPLNLRTIETDAQAFKHYRAFEEWFREFSTRENAGTVHVIPEWPSLKLSELEFADIDHLTFADPFIRYMSEEISKNARVK